MDDYQPISCVAHERLEFAVLRRQTLRLVVRDEAGGQAELCVMPVDVYTRDGAEWLVFRDQSGLEQRLRLDRIVAATPL